MGGRLVVVGGLPATGKTTLGRDLEARGAVRLSPDEWMVALGIDLYDQTARGQVEALQWALAQQLLLRGLTVVDECGCWQRSERDLRREWARAHGVAVELRWLEAPLAELQARIVARNRDLPPGWTPVDPDDLVDWDRQIQRPDPEELAAFDPPPP